MSCDLCGLQKELQRRLEQVLAEKSGLEDSLSNERDMRDEAESKSK